MRISIALCTFNGERYLAKQLNSFIEQTEPPFELVVCDDGSTDSTLQIVEQFARTASFPVRIFTNERNLGTTKNFEKAISLCQGDVIALSDQDDEWYPTKLSTVSAAMTKFPDASAVFTDADVINESSERTGRNLWSSLYFGPGESSPYVGPALYEQLLKLNFIATGATMAIRSKFRPAFLPIPEIWVHDAWISWIAAIRSELVCVPDRTIAYRIHDSQQIGLAPSSPVQHARLAKNNNQKLFRLIATRLSTLWERLKRDGYTNQSLLSLLEEKIRFMEGRGNLNSSPIRRLYWIFSSRQDYSRFARGAVSMLSDAFIVDSNGENESR
jgi:glycosyltransferase involved in cell wall biosynthesis